LEITEMGHRPAKRSAAQPQKDFHCFKNKGNARPFHQSSLPKKKQKAC